MKRRISCELEDDLLLRLEMQADAMGVTRQNLIEAAVLGLVREFEQIDAENPIPIRGGTR